MTRNIFCRVLLTGLFLFTGCTNQNATAITQPYLKETEPNIGYDAATTSTAANAVPTGIGSSTNNSTSNEKFLIINQRDYYLSTLNGSDSTLLFSGKSSPIEMASLSPDKTKFSYFKDNFIYIQDIETQKITMLNKEIIGSMGGNLRWSPDGKKLFMSCANAQQPSIAICSIDTSNGQVEVLINEKNTDEFCATNPNSIKFQDLNNDGTKIAYFCSVIAEQGQRGSFAIYMYDIPSGTSIKVLDSQTQDAAWQIYTALISPDGNFLLLDGANQNYILNIYLLDWKTGALTQLTNDSEYHFTATLWGAESNSFYVHRTSANEPYKEENFLMDINGTILSTINVQGKITR